MTTTDEGLVLDCASFDSALASAAALLHLSDGELVAKLATLDWDAVREDPDVLPRLMCGRSILPFPSATMWFHGTRVPRETTFQDGLLPLPMVLDSIWRTLGTLVTDWSTPEEWSAFRQSCTDEHPYYAKTHAGAEPGPFAFLAREAFFSGDQQGNSDFLDIPEIVEDICCWSYHKRSENHVCERYRAATHPCIVKFKWPSRPRDLADALRYLDGHLKGYARAARLATTNIGEPVPYSAIIKIEWPEYTPRPRPPAIDTADLPTVTWRTE